MLRFIGGVFGAAISVLVALYQAFVISYAWNNFVAGWFLFPRISVMVCFGLVAVYGLFTVKIPEQSLGLKALYVRLLTLAITYTIVLVSVVVVNLFR